jgi:hypothetical protein
MPQAAMLPAWPPNAHLEYQRFYGLAGGGLSPVFLVSCVVVVVVVPPGVDVVFCFFTSVFWAQPIESSAAQIEQTIKRFIVVLIR